MVLNIPLIDGWKIENDRYNIILINEQQNKRWFYASISSAIESLIDKKIRGFDSITLSQLIFDLNSLRDALNQALLPLKLRVGPADEVGK